MENHRAELVSLAEKDPEFFKFLEEQETDLLEFNESDYEADETEERGGEEEDRQEIEEEVDDVKIGEHVLTLKLDGDGRKIVNRGLINLLEEVLTDKKQKNNVIREAVGISVELFIACASKAGVKNEEPKFVITSDKLVDVVFAACLNNVGRCLLFLLRPIRKTVKNKRGVSFKFWKKYRGLAKLYLQIMVKFMAEIRQSETLVDCVNAVLEMTELLVHFPKTRRLLVKILIRMWSRRSVEERGAAFKALKHLCESDSNQFKLVYKKCYVAYVSASNNVSSNAWKKLTFMQKTFGELTYLYPEMAYEFVFSYIRQLAIHLRNAKIAKRKDLIKTVYNWQYVLGLYLWASVLATGREHEEDKSDATVKWVRELLYPLIQITIGLIGVFVAPRFLPLRLHCVRILIYLQVNFDVFIPTLSLSADCLDDLLKIDKERPLHTKVTQKTKEIRDLISLKNEMLEDANYRRKVAKEIFEVLSESAELIKDDPAFFEVYVPVKITLKNFLRECKNIEHKRMFDSFQKSIRDQDVDI